MTVSIDLSELDSVLATLSNSPRLQGLAAKAAAESYTDEILDWIEGGYAFTTRNGQLEQSIGWRPVDNGAEVYANAEYAGYVEFGTRPHVIRPKPGRGGLKIPIPGLGYIIRREVHHPGSKPHPFFFTDENHRKDAMQKSVLLAISNYVERAHG